MFCKNCGNQIPDGVRFCPKCGKVTGAVLSNQSAINQNAANKNLMGHTATGKSTMDSDTIRSEKTTQSGWSGEISEASAIKKSKTKKQRYLRAYNLGHFGVLIGCVMEIVAVFLPNYTNGFLIGFLNKFTDFMGDTPSIMKFMTTFVFGESARKLTGYLDTELRNVEIYQSFRDYTSTAAIMLVVMGILVLVSFICVLRYMHYKHTQKDLSTIKIKKMQENEKESVFPLFTENLEMKMWTLAVRQEQQVEKVFEKI